MVDHRNLRSYIYTILDTHLHPAPDSLPVVQQVDSMGYKPFHVSATVVYTPGQNPASPCSLCSVPVHHPVLVSGIAPDISVQVFLSLAFAHRKKGKEKKLKKKEEKSRPQQFCCIVG